jgi:hypothetical protein
MGELVDWVSEQEAVDQADSAYAELDQRGLTRKPLRSTEPGGRTNGHMPSEGYEGLIDRIREVVCDTLPLDSTVAVVSKGDDELLDLYGRRRWHFPQSEVGLYAGHYPADDEEAMAHLESLRAKGAEFLLFPATAFWWLEHYGGFRRHLEGRYREVVEREDTCLIFDLREPRTERTEATKTHAPPPG